MCVYLASQSEAAIRARSSQLRFVIFVLLGSPAEWTQRQVTAAEYKKREPQSLRGLVFDNHREVEADHKANTLLALKSRGLFLV